jgi:protein subunit release factor B
MSKRNKELLFSVKKKDFRWDEFRTGGNGGQAQNKKSVGVRCVHEPSGASGEGRDSRSKKENERNAFRRCVQSDKFQNWIKIKSIDMTMIDNIVEDQMRPSNLKVEIKDNGLWKMEE